VSETINRILKQYWGFDEFRPLQSEVINSVISGHDTLALMPTGGGKSLCFQVPALALNGLCLVISPLIALMKDQVENLNKRGINAKALYTGLTYSETDRILDACIFSNVNFLYVSPERLQNETFRIRLAKMPLKLIAVDEAHCISQWGYDFRPSYMQIAELRDSFAHIPVIALTATATPHVVQDIQQKLNFKNGNVFKKSFVRSNLAYVVRESQDKTMELENILAKVKGSSVIYVKSRKETKRISDLLQHKNISADFYHAGLNNIERARRQENWIQNKTRVIVCTNAFGMGIDKPDVRSVIHTDVPDSIEAYFQEAGRAGRDEKKAYAVLLTQKSDITQFDKRLESEFPTVEEIKHCFNQLNQQLLIPIDTGEENTYDLDIALLAEKSKIKPAKVMAILKLLEQQKIIELSEGYDATSRIKCIVSNQTLYKLQSEQKQFELITKLILRSCEGVFEDYTKIDEYSIAKRMKTPVNVVIDQLNWLNTNKYFSYKQNKNLPLVTLLQNRVQNDKLQLDFKYLTFRKEQFINSLTGIRNYITNHHTCRSIMLTAYFGETGPEPCGTCDVCLADKKKSATHSDIQNISTLLQKLISGQEKSLEEIKSIYPEIKQEAFINTLTFLLDMNRVKRTAGNKFIWVA
jgi:ATP-dependent DNA helicase RecQ